MLLDIYRSSTNWTKCTQSNPNLSAITPYAYCLFLYSAMIQLFIRMRWCHPPEKVLILGRQKLILIPSQVDVERKVGLITYILAVTCKSSMPNVHSSFSKLLESYYWSSSAYLKCFFNKSFLLYVSKMGYLILKQILCLFLNLF